MEVRKRELRNVQSTLGIIQRPGDDLPYNEFKENQKVFRHSFPHLFLLGEGGGDSGTLSDAYLKHLLLQFTCKFSKDTEFNMLVFDQAQRHKAAQLVSQRVLKNPTAMQKFGNIVGSEEFKVRLANCVQDADGIDAKALLKEMETILSRSTRAKVPHSAGERNYVVTLLFALAHRFGCSSSFLTISPDDTNDRVTMRLMYPSRSNNMFPAVSTIESTSDGECYEFHHIVDGECEGLQFNVNRLPMKQYQRANDAAQNPIECAKHFQFLIRVLFEELLGITVEMTKKSQPRYDSSLQVSEMTLMQMKRRNGPPALGQGLAALGVTETQEKLSLHMHAAVWTTMKPQMFQELAGCKYFASKLGHILKTMYKTEIPASMHFMNACNVIKGIPKKRMAGLLPPQSIDKNDERGLLIFCCECGSSVQIHEHRSPGTCDPKCEVCGKKCCRVAKKSPAVDMKTCAIELVEDDDAEAGYKILMQLEPRNENTFAKNRILNTGLVPVDSRIIMFVLERNTIRITSSTPGDDVNCFDMHQELFCDMNLWAETIIEQLQRIDQRQLTVQEKECIYQLTQEEATRICNFLVTANGLVTDFSPVGSAVLRCNTAMYFLGSSGQCISIFFYLVKYLTKEANNLTDMLTVIANAHELTMKFPREALPNETADMRTSKQFQNKILNSCEGGAREIPDTVIGALLIGMKGFCCTETFTYVFGHDAVKEAKARVVGGGEEEEEGVSIERAAAAADDDGKFGEPDDYVMESLPIYDTENNKKEPHSQYDIYIHRSNKEYSTKWVHVLTQLEHSRKTKVLTDEQIQQLARKIALVKCFAQNNLEAFSLLEFSVCVSIKKITPEQYEELHSELMAHVDEDTLDDYLDERKRKVGRPAAKMFLMAETHSLFRFYALALNAKQTTPIMAGGLPPAYPVEPFPQYSRASRTITLPWNCFGAYVVANFWPAQIDGPDCVPGDASHTAVTLDWSGFCRILDHLYSADASFSDGGRLAAITNLAFATRHHPEFGNSMKNIVTKYRTSAADDLNKPHLLNPLGKKVQHYANNNDHDDDNGKEELMREAFELIEKLQNNNASKSNRDDLKSLQRDAEKMRFLLCIEKHAEDNAFGSIRKQLAATHVQPLQPISHHRGAVAIGSEATILEMLKDKTERLNEEYVTVVETNMSSSSSIISNINSNSSSSSSSCSSSSSTWSANEQEPTLKDEELIALLQLKPNEQVEPCQLAVIRDIFTTLQCKKDDENAVKIIIVGGPGTGKTFTLGQVMRIVSERPFLFVANSGSAASLLPGGKTICNAFAFNPRHKHKSLSETTKLPSLMSGGQATKFAVLKDHFVNKGGVLIVDEISQVAALTMYHMGNRMQELHLDSDNSARKALPWAGNHNILCGDWFQIPSVNRSIPELLYQHIINNEKDEKNQQWSSSVMEHFKQFKQHKLTVNKRSEGDPEHIARVAQLVDVFRKEPISDEIIDYFLKSILSSEDVKKDPQKWLVDAICLTTSNAERLWLNKYRAVLAAIFLKEVIVTWEVKITSDHDLQSLTEEERENLREKNLELTGFFLRGAPCAMTENFNTSKNISNGSQGYMNALVFDHKDILYRKTMELIENAQPGSTVHVPIRPLYFIVDVKNDGERISQAEQIDAIHATPLRENYVCVSISAADTKKTAEKLESVCIGSKVLTQVKYYVPSVVLLFACTFDKSQGKSMDAVILCLHENPWVAITLAKLYVAYTRIRLSCNLRVWPFRDLGLERLKKLKFSAAVVCLTQAYDDDGIFRLAKYKDAHAAYVRLHAEEHNGQCDSSSSSAKNPKKQSNKEKQNTASSNKQKSNSSSSNSIGTRKNNNISSSSSSAVDSVDWFINSGKGENKIDIEFEQTGDVESKTSNAFLNKYSFPSFCRQQMIKQVSETQQDDLWLMPDYYSQDLLPEDIAYFKGLLAAANDITKLERLMLQRAAGIAKVYINIPNWRHRCYNTIAPCGRCVYSSFFSSSMISRRNDLPATFSINLKDNKEKQSMKKMFLEELQLFTENEAYRSMSAKGKDNLKAMKKDSQLGVADWNDIPDKFWGDSDEFFDGEKKLHPLRHISPGPREKKQKACLLWATTRGIDIDSVFQLRWFVGGGNFENASNFSFGTLSQWFREFHSPPAPVAAAAAGPIGAVQSHSFAYASHHAFNISNVASDEFLAKQMEKATKRLAETMQRYIQSSARLQSKDLTDGEIVSFACAMVGILKARLKKPDKKENSSSSSSSHSSSAFNKQRGSSSSSSSSIGINKTNTISSNSSSDSSVHNENWLDELIKLQKKPNKGPNVMELIKQYSFESFCRQKFQHTTQLQTKQLFLCPDFKVYPLTDTTQQQMREFVFNLTKWRTTWLNNISYLEGVCKDMEASGLLLHVCLFARIPNWRQQFNPTILQSNRGVRSAVVSSSMIPAQNKEAAYCVNLADEDQQHTKRLLHQPFNELPQNSAANIQFKNKDDDLQTSLSDRLKQSSLDDGETDAPLLPHYAASYDEAEQFFNSIAHSYTEPDPDYRYKACLYWVHATEMQQPCKSAHQENTVFRLKSLLGGENIQNTASEDFTLQSLTDWITKFDDDAHSIAFAESSVFDVSAALTDSFLAQEIQSAKKEMLSALHEYLSSSSLKVRENNLLSQEELSSLAYAMFNIVPQML